MPRACEVAKQHLSLSQYPSRWFTAFCWFFFGGHCTMSWWFQITVNDDSKIQVVTPMSSASCGHGLEGLFLRELHLSLSNEALLPSPCPLTWLFEFLLAFFTIFLPFHCLKWFVFFCSFWDFGFSILQVSDEGIQWNLHECVLLGDPRASFSSSPNLCFLTSF